MKLVFVLGTRPELIKCAPVIREAARRRHQVTVVSTGQHRQMLRGLFGFFGIRPDADLDVMRPDQSLSSLSARVLERLDHSASRLESADWILVQGDTTSAAMAGYWAFCRRLRVAHIEAGLRTYDLGAPFPEEGNRQLLGRLATLHLAPTEQAVRALKAEGIAGRAIRRVGNTSIDALLDTLARVEQAKRSERLPREIREFAGAGPVVLVTAHRRESFGAGFDGICEGILRILKAEPGVRVVFPVHPNPNVRKPVRAALGANARVLLCEPLPYVAFAELMSLADVLLTDSGGVQEEGPTLRKAIVVMRSQTERPEGVEAGFARLVGTDSARIARAVSQALKHGCLGRGRNPYGDGHAARRIVEALATVN